MPRLLLASFDPGRFAGHARLGGEEWGFTGSDELLRPVRDYAELTLLAGGMDAERVELSLRVTWPGEPGSIINADDAAYLLDTPCSSTLDGLARLGEVLLRELPHVADDLLAQIAELVGEAGERVRLGWLEAELHRRHDVLSRPAHGEVDTAQLFPRRFAGNAPGKRELPPDLLERLFTAHGALESAFAGYEDRPQQQEMARTVESALADRAHAAIEAGTGVGKSLAYLLPLALHSARTGQLALVSTNTINLQQQLMELDIPRLRRVLDMLDIRVTLLKGREHYLCLKRLEETWLKNSQQARSRRSDLLAPGTSALLFVIKTLLRTAADNDGDLDRLDAPRELRQADRARISSSLDCSYKTCLGDRCEYRGTCHFFAQRDEAMRSNIVITNHALVFALARSGEGDADSVVSKAEIVVFDEAHNLESAITSQYTLEVTHQTPIDLGNRLLEVVQQEQVRRRLDLSPDAIGEQWCDTFRRVVAAVAGLPKWMALLADVRRQVQSLLEQAVARRALSQDDPNQLSPGTAEGTQRQVLEILGQLARRFHPLVERMAALAADLSILLLNEQSEMFTDDPQLQMDLQALTSDLLECCSALEQWRPEDSSAITWFNCRLAGVEAEWEYLTAPLQVGPLFQALASTKQSVVLCSATLTVAGGFDYLQRSLGYESEQAEKARWVSLSSPFDYQQQALLLVATDLDNPTGDRRESYLEQLREVIAGAADVFGGGVLVLFNSYRDLNHIAARLEGEELCRRLLVQGVSGSRAEIAERFRTAGNRILLATRSFWEGFDVAGDALQCVILAKLPFANYRDPIHAGRQRAIDSAGGDSFRSYSLPLAAMQLKQGFGRLVRTSADRGCVFLLDSRAVRARYGATFLSSLPDPKLFTGTYLDCLHAAREFMTETTRGAGTTPAIHGGAGADCPNASPVSKIG